jgi:hypothetical protein
MALVKVGILAFKAVCKPLSKGLAQRCKTSPPFRTACIAVARFQNTSLHKLQVSLLAARPSSAMEKRARCVQHCARLRGGCALCLFSRAAQWALVP